MRDVCRAGQEVKQLLRVVLQHQRREPFINLDQEQHNSLVHCGRTKVFLSQPMVSAPFSKR